MALPGQLADVKLTLAAELGRAWLPLKLTY
jgi:hypothetical protein